MHPLLSLHPHPLLPLVPYVLFLFILNLYFCFTHIPYANFIFFHSPHTGTYSRKANQGQAAAQVGDGVVRYHGPPLSSTVYIYTVWGRLAEQVF